MRVLAVCLVISTGCGSNDGPSKTHDAAVDVAIVDTPRPIDAAPPIDAPPMVAGHTHYVIDRMLLPATNTQARDYGQDLDNNATVDNQLGMVISAFAGQGLEAQVTMDSVIDRGNAIMLADLGADDLTTTALATFTIYQGANPVPPACMNLQDTVCRKHLAGTGAFSINATAPTNPPLVGSITGGVLTAGPNPLTIQIAFADSPPVMVTMIGSRVQLTNTATTSMGKIGGGITMTDVDMKVIPGMRDGFEAMVMRDCTMLSSPPNCGCPQDSNGKTMLGLFDVSPKDCSISVAEVRQSTLIQSLLAPDVMINNQMALSLGVSVTAVKGTFTAPM
jgi:hypothetical protein